MNQKYPIGLKNPETDGDLVLNLHPKLIEILLFSRDWCKQNGVKLELTRTISEKMPWSETDIHEDGRAADGSILGWPLDKVDGLVKVVNDKYAKEFGAFSIHDGLPRALEHEVREGVCPHFHFQVRRGT